jgi:uncharacterized membrane protein (DUF373 family)
MLKTVDIIEKLIIRVLIVLMLVATALGTVSLGYMLIIDILSPPLLRLEVTELFEMFGLVLVLLIGMELLRSMRMFLTEENIKAELVVEVAVIALCNKIITLDIKHTTGAVLLGLAALLVGLSMGYFVLRSMRIE